MIGLAEYITYLDANGLESNRYQIAIWARVATLVSIILMLLLALPFNFGSLRSAGTGTRVAIGVLGGVAFFIFNKTFTSSGLVFGLMPVMVAWLPTLGLATVVAILLRRVG